MSPQKKIMPLVGGHLRTILSVDIAVFGTASLLFAIWLIVTRRGYLRQMLWMTLLSNLARTMLGLLLLFDFSRVVRLPDGIEIYWLRWAIYACVWGLAGLTHVLAKFSVQQCFYQRWNLSLMGFGLACVAVTVASRMGTEDQRIVALCIGGLFFFAGIAMLFIYAQRRDAAAWFVYISQVLLLSAVAVAFMLGHAAWRVLDAQYFGVPQRRRRVLDLQNETIFYLCADFALYVLWPIVQIWIHWPFAVRTCTKKDDDTAVADDCRQLRTWTEVTHGSTVVAPSSVEYQY